MSHVELDQNGAVTSYVGVDAMHLARAIILRSSVRAHQTCGIIPTRGVTLSRMFEMAREYTGQSYRRGEHERCVSDLTTWIEAMKSALPVEKRT